MADRNDHRGSWSGGGDDRWRREGSRERSGGEERRAFGPRGGHGEGEHEPWRRGRYGSLYDQDRTNYGSGWDARRGDYGRGQPEDDRLEDHRRSREWDSAQDHRSRSGRGGGDRQNWRSGGGAPYGDLELNAGGRGYEEFGAPHDYAYHPRADHEFDPDYLHWRDEQLRLHDRDYHEWRRHQQQQYDEEYRRFRTERRDTFGRSFHEWRSQRQTVGDATPGSTAQTGGGMPNQGQNQQPGQQASGHQASLGAGDAQFGKSSPQVQAATDGQEGRRDHEDRSEGGSHS